MAFVHLFFYAKLYRTHKYSFTPKITMTFSVTDLYDIIICKYIFQGSSPYDLKAFAKQANAGSETSIISLNQLAVSEPESD